MKKFLQKEQELTERALRYEIEFDYINPDFKYLEEQIIEIEANIADLAYEAKELGIEYSFDTDPVELEDWIETIKAKENKYHADLRSDYYSSRL